MKANDASWHLHAMFIVSCLIVTHAAIGQKIKKGIIYYDDNPSGKVDGRISAFREADLTFSSMDDTQLLTVQEKHYDLRNPLYKSYPWLAVKFVDTGKEMKIHFPNRCFSEKCILATLEKDGGIQFRGLPITNQDEIIAKYDYSEFIHTDTIAKRKEEQALSEKLKSNYTTRTTIDGPKLLPVNDKRIVQGGSAYAIVQGDVVIGKFLASEIPGTFPSTEIDIFEILSGENSELHAARVFIKKDATGPEIGAFTFVDRKWHKIYPSSPALNIEIAKFLIDRGYL
jgi:hypothetical protein